MGHPARSVRTRLPDPVLSGTIVVMETDRAQVMAEHLHADDREDGGIPVIRHVRRVASRTPAEARAVAWLHEVLEFTAVTEQRPTTDDRQRANATGTA